LEDLMSLLAEVLLVDDEVTIRLTLGALLERAGYGVTVADNGEEAVTLLERQAFDLLLVDMKMPGMDGVQVIAAARARQPDIAIIVLTGHGSLETAIAGLHYHIFDYLLKTTAPDQVIERVKAGLAARDQELRQHTLINVVGAAMQELRGAPSTGSRPRCAGQRTLADGWGIAVRYMAPGSQAGRAKIGADANRVSCAAVPS
jgi:DNA-binding response OmpR family regulator